MAARSRSWLWMLAMGLTIMACSCMLLAVAFMPDLATREIFEIAPVPVTPRP
jgi:hypothetical protein